MVGYVAQAFEGNVSAPIPVMYVDPGDSSSIEFYRHDFRVME
jgi:hypothetical protein